MNPDYQRKKIGCRERRKPDQPSDFNVVQIEAEKMGYAEIRKYI